MNFWSLGPSENASLSLVGDFYFMVKAESFQCVSMKKSWCSVFNQILGSAAPCAKSFFVD